MAGRKIKGLTVQIDGDTTDLSKALQKPEGQAKSLQAELKEINSALKFNPDSVELLTQKSSVLSGQLAATTDKLMLLKNASKQVQDQAARGDIGEEQYRAFQREVLKTEDRLNGLQTELSQTDGKLGVLGGSIKSAAASAAVFDQHLNNVEKELEETKNAAKSAEGGLTTLNVAFGNLVADGIRMALDAMKEFIVQGIEYKSSLSEVQNVIDTVFGPESAGQVQSWSKSAINAFGLSELTAKQYASTLGSMIDAMGVTGQKNAEMSMTLTQLAADWASFRDMKPEVTFDKIRSAVSGETEAIKSLGIVMTVNNLQRYAQSQGIKQNYKDLSEAERVTLRYNFILDQSSKVLGDFAKTSESFHNQQTLLTEQTKALSGEFAENFLPILTEVLTETNKYLEKNGDTLANLGSIVATVVNVLANLLKIIAALPPEMIILVGGLLLAVKAFKSVDTGLLSFVKAGKDATGMLDPFTIKVIALIAAISILLFLILSLKEGTDQAAKSMERAGNAAGNFSNANVSGAQRGFAKGTRSAPRGTAWVGEEGPELVQFRGGERVFTARQSAQMAQSGGGSAIGDQITHNQITVAGLTELERFLEFQDNERRRERAKNGGK